MSPGGEKAGNGPVAVVLAAGQGTRMRSSTPKVLHRVLGRTLLEWVFEAARASGCRRIVCVIGHQADRVRESTPGDGVDWVVQEEQRGTGHALAQARPAVERLGPSRVLVLSGDVPLVTPATLESLIDAGTEGWGSMAVADLEDPGSFGRVIERPDGTLKRIVEAADADAEELAIRTVNAGTYVLPVPEIFSELERLRPDNAQGELYLTDALTAAARGGAGIRLQRLADTAEALGVNRRADLTRAREAFSRRRAQELQDAGVTVWDPDRLWIEPSVEVGADTEIHAGVTLCGRTRIGEGCVLHPGVWVRDSVIEDGVVLEPHSVLDGAEVETEARVGPFARLRPGTVIGPASKIGNFVEVKNSRLEAGVKAGHLAYLGDAQIGPGANIGAGTVTCNYDGENKHRTEIGSGAFVGSDTMLVAPVRLGDEAVTAAGSVITADVPDGGLGVGRARQRTIDGWAERKKRKAKKG